MNKLYSRIVWENLPSEKTALNESNLNRMDLAIDNIDNRVIEMDSTKVNKEVANTLIKNWSIDEKTGIITIEKLNGEKILFDLNIEKIPVNFKLSEDGILTMTTDDGTKFTANIGAMIPVLTFEDSDEIAVSVSGSGVNKTYSFSIKAGSVTEDKLQPNFLADIKTEVAKAQASQSAAAQSASAASSSATLAESYTHGGTGAREGEDADNARYYMEQAKAVSAVDIATTEKAGIVKPDGDTITVDPDGTIRGQSKVDEMTGATAEANGTSGTVPAPKAGQENHVLKGNGTWEAITYDSELSAESENAPQTKVVDAKTKKIEENLSQLSNPNLLINPDFKINQRGGKISVFGAILYSDPECTVPIGPAQDTNAVTVIKVGNNYRWKTLAYGPVYIKASDVVDGYCENEKYTVDRWNISIDTAHNNFVVKTSNDGVVLSGYGWFFQPIECKSLLSKKCTLTAHTSIGTLTTTAEFPNTNGSVAGNVDIDQKLSMFLECNSNLPRVVFHCNITEEITIYDVKLELGDIATPFVPPDTATELLKCQRYYEEGSVCLRTGKTTGEFNTSVYFTVRKRALPTITIVNENTHSCSFLLMRQYVLGETEGFDRIYTANQDQGFMEVSFKWIADAEIY